MNQIQREYNGLGQLITEYQEHGGAVNTSTSPKVQYTYSEMSGGANHSRLTGIVYPDGMTLSYNYASGLDDAISRLSSISDTSGTLESYSYLGLGTVVIRSHSQPGVDLTYVKQSGESNGDAGDQYTGLDRFGRVVDQRWIKTSSGTATDRFQYGYDRDWQSPVARQPRELGVRRIVFVRQFESDHLVRSRHAQRRPKTASPGAAHAPARTGISTRWGISIR